MVDCRGCNARFRVDHFLANFNYSKIESLSLDELNVIFLNDPGVMCINCGQKNFTSVRKFNLMFSTQNSNIATREDQLYLRPETAQGIFVNFKNIQRLSRLKLPFGVGQIGKAFRNEITIGNGIFRTREFEQMELEWFVHPSDAD